MHFLTSNSDSSIVNSVFCMLLSFSLNELYLRFLHQYNQNPCNDTLYVHVFITCSTPLRTQIGDTLQLLCSANYSNLFIQVLLLLLNMHVMMYSYNDFNTGNNLACGPCIDTLTRLWHGLLTRLHASSFKACNAMVYGYIYMV